MTVIFFKIGYIREIIHTLLIICISQATTFAQPVSFDHYTVKDGLSQSEIICIFQDSEGFIWFGTQNGLNKFNGYSFDKYFRDPTEINSLSNSWIFSIAEDSEGNLLLGTKGGLNCFNKKEGRFTHIEHKTPGSIIGDNFVYGIAADDSCIYVNTPPELTIINSKSGSVRAFRNDFPYSGELYDRGSPLLRSKTGILWIGTHNGLFSFNPGTEKFTAFRHDEKNEASITHDHITALFEDSEGKILAGTEHGLTIIDPGSGKILRFVNDKNDPEGFNHNFIRSVCKDHNGVIWVGTEGGGLNKMILNEQTGISKIQHFRSGTELRYSLSHDIIYSLYEDDSYNLWIGTISGINKTDLKKKNITYYKRSDNPDFFDIPDNIIASVYKDETGKIWIGSWGKGLFILDRASRNIIQYRSEFPGKYNIPGNYVHVIFKDSRSRIWIGTRNGVAVYNSLNATFIPAHEYFSTPDFNCFGNTRVYCIMEDSNGKIWVGTGNGIRILDVVHKEVTVLKAESEEPFSICSNLVYSILEDNDNEVWIATSEGLNRYITGEKRMISYLSSYDNPNAVCDNFTISLHRDDNMDIWIGTVSGLNKFRKDDSLFYYYSVKDGLPGNVIYDIIDDNDNNLWFSTGSGLAFFNPENESEGFLILDELRGLEFNLKAVYRGNDGEMFFGGIDGLVSFYPDSLGKNSFVPPVRITSIEKERDGIRQKMNVYNDEIVLSYKDYSFIIEFAALDYTHPQKNRYAYKMKGISERWIDLGTQRSVHFTNLPPGKYIFTVKGTNNDGIWNEEGTTIRIRINPPWWRSRYAYIIYVLLLLLLIMMIIRIRERNLIREKRILEQKVKERTAEIELQKTKVEESERNLKELNATKDKFFSILAHDLKNPFANLYSLSEAIIRSYDDLDEKEKIQALENIHKSSEFIFGLMENLLMWANFQRGVIEFVPEIFNLSRIIEININLFKLHADNKGVNISSSTDDNIEAFGDREMINTVLRNLINNAVKFTGKGGSVNVDVENKISNLEIRVKDEGVGISEEDLKKLFRIDVKYKSKGTAGETGTGLGLVICKEFVEKNGGIIWCESKAGAGTTFFVQIPAGQGGMREEKGG